MNQIRRFPVCFCLSVPICVLLSILFLFSACTAPPQPDLFYLLDQIEKEAPQYAIPPDALLFRNGVYYVCRSLREENDLLLTLREDERGKIDRVTLTARRGAATAKEDLPAFSVLLARLLIPGCDPEALQKELGFETAAGAAPSGSGEIAGSPASFYRCGRYRAALYTGRYACCFIIERRAEEETTAEK